MGEYTVYSNWSTALAAYIVEQTSGIDYVTYVNENIFAPLGMEHCSIEPQQKDNKWVGKKRSELNCYSRYAQEEHNKDYGECRYAVQLFPAGACMSTLDDLSKFGQAFVAEDCPLFENKTTVTRCSRQHHTMGIPMLQKHATVCGQSSVRYRLLDTGGCTGILPTVAVYGFILFGVVCLLTLVIKLIVLIIRKIRKNDKEYTKADTFSTGDIRSIKHNICCISYGTLWHTQKIICNIIVHTCGGAWYHFTCKRRTVVL